VTAIQTNANPSLSSLRRRFRGTIVEPGAPEWGDATQAFNLAFTQRPALVALPADAEDVRTLVAYARQTGMQLAPQRTGHNAEPLGAMDNVILVKTDLLQGVVIDTNKRIARVRSGAKWETVVPRASDLGLAALHGSTPDVSVTGYSLGGGVGWYARKLGLSTNSVTAIELVTADGRLRRVDHEHEPELFWALRGGGGNFGIVTALEVQLYAIPEVYAGVLFFPWERSAEVLHAWHAWTATVPDEVTSVGRILQFPPIPEIPEPLRGGQFVVVEAVYLGEEAEGAELLRPLRELGPAMDTFAMVPPAGIAELHMDPPNPVPYTGEGMMLGELTEAAIDGFVAAAGPGSGSPLLSAEIRHVGGALSRPASHHGALATFDASFLTFGVGMVLDEGTYRANRTQLAALREALTPVDTGREYLNFTEHKTDPARFYTSETYRRLRAVKSEVDRDDLFRANHPIAPA
jgi:FAD binding domain-containing protein/berberine-like enzyme